MYEEYLAYKNRQLKKFINNGRYIDNNLLDIILSYYNINIFPKNIEIWNDIIWELNIDWFDL